MPGATVSVAVELRVGNVTPRIGLFGSGTNASRTVWSAAVVAAAIVAAFAVGFLINRSDEPAPGSGG